MAIQTGVATSIAACTAVITFVVYPQSQRNLPSLPCLSFSIIVAVSDAVLYSVGRVYTCSMLFTLNSRGRIGRVNATGTDLNHNSEQLMS